MPSTPSAVETGQAGIDLAELRGRNHGVFLPAELPRGDVAGLKGGRAGFDDAADHASGHHLADPEWRCVRSPIAHASAHVGIDREIEPLHEDLAVANIGHGPFFELEVGFGGPAGGTGR
ncbi:MAG: hypothetical protein R2724_05960 [Bryobacterales bacterium]